MSTTVQRINNIVYGPKRDIKVDNRGVGSYIFDKFQENAEKTFQINALDGEQQSYSFVNKKCIRIALEMRKRGVKENDVILLCTSNSMESFLPLLSTLYLNAISTTLDPSISLRDSIHLLNIIRPKMIFVQESSMQLIESALQDAKFKTEIIVIGNHAKYSTYSEFLNAHLEEESFVPNNVEDIKNTCTIFFSSGTTGLPKAIELSNYAMLYITDGLEDTGCEHQTILFFTSTYWLSGVLLTFRIIRRGTKRIVVKGFEPEQALKTMHEYKVTDIFSAPSFTYRITEDLVKRYPCPELKTIIFGGSSMSSGQMIKFRKYFPNCTMFLLYAQTETSGIITSFSAKHFPETFQNKPSSSGQPVSNIQIKIVDLDTDELLGPNLKGEIRVKTPSVCNGYYNQDSSAVLGGDGFVKTGDVGYFDEDNCMYVCDRIKDMFKYQSWHIVPQSLENVIVGHPSVAEAMVIGIPSEADGHIPMGLVVLRKDAPNVNEENLINFANEKLLEREQLRAGLKIVKHIPKGPTGKASRKHVTDLVISDQLQTLLE